MPIGPYLGALGSGIMPGYDKGYDASLDQFSTAAAGRGLQVLQMLSQQPQQPTPPPQQQQMQPWSQGGPSPSGGPPPMGGGQPPGMPPQMAGGGVGPIGSPPMGQPMPGGGMPAPVGQRPQGPPIAPPPQGGMQPPMQGGPSPQMQPQGFGQQQGGGLDWRTLIMAIQRGNPGAPPQVLMAAVNKLVPLMNSQSMLEWRQMQAQLGQQRVDVQARGQDIRADTAERGQDVRAETAKGAQDVAKRGQDVRAETAKEGQKATQERFNVREARITAHQQITADQTWQRLNQQRLNLERQIKEGGQKQLVSQWRAILDAQHKKATEIINSYSINTTMPKEQRDKLLKESNDAYEKAIKEIGGSPTFSDRFTGGGQSSP